VLELSDRIINVLFSHDLQVGKMVNIARIMGLGMDPDECPEKYTLFEAEARRRIWWEMYSYDL
jgi:hypothetical protein